MKKTALLNSRISAVISEMGHFDKLTIGDAGLPVPQGVERIDLAVTLGVPGFLQVFDAVMSELKVQRATIAAEMCDKNIALYEHISAYCEKEGIELIQVQHEEFKRQSAQSKAVIRTGECKAYANIILESGVVF